MIVAVAVVLVFSARSLKKERDLLLQGFAATQQAAVDDLATTLEDRLLDTDENGRVIATLVHAVHEPSPATGDERARNLLASFSAMANVVRHYRSLALFGRRGLLKISAVDPSETQSMGAELIRVSQSTAARTSSEPRLDGPFEIVPGRHFYLYSFGVDDDMVVIAIDAPRFLQSAVRALPGSRAVISDPGGTEWSGCAPNLPCAPGHPSDSLNLAPAGGREGTAWLDDRSATALGLSGAKAVAAWSTVGPKPLGRWRVLLAVSAAALHDREQALVRQLVVTAIGLLGAIGLIGYLIIRQQRLSAALAERLRNSETLRSLEGQLIRAEKLATTGVLAAGIAHEVGTPLGIIRARAELLLDDLASTDERRALDSIIQQIDHISSTIRQVLDFSRSQAVELTRVAPEPALRAVLELLDHRFKIHHLDVRAVVEPDIPDIAADPNQLQQVLINLILNACDASPVGGAIVISATLSADASNVLWEVRDQGAGIAQEHLLAVFDPFFTTKKRGEGTGLGLPVATSIIRNHGGEITLASHPGEGTTVTFRWPVAREELHVQG